MPYFIKIAGRPFGPFDENQLLEMKSRGRVNPSTEISSDRANWQAASTLDFLFSAPSQPASDSSRQLQKSTSDPGPQLPLAVAAEQNLWFYSFDGNSGYGPVPPSSIVQLFQSGQLNGQSYVWKDGETAQYLQTIPEFSRYFGGMKAENTDRPAVKERHGESGDFWKPLDRSIDWLMFLKILCLASWILFGLVFILGVIFLLSKAVASDSASVLLGTMIGILLQGGYYYLMFRPFWAMWKYHSVLQRATVSRQDSELAEANRYLFQFWKDSGIFVIVNLAIVTLTVVIVVIGAGTSAGFLQRFH